MPGAAFAASCSSNDYLCLENNISAEHNCMIGDGHTSYAEWFDYCDLSKEDLIDYKDWLGYDEEEEDEEED